MDAAIIPKHTVARLDMRDDDVASEYLRVCRNDVRCDALFTTLAEELLVQGLVVLVAATHDNVPTRIGRGADEVHDALRVVSGARVKVATIWAAAIFVCICRTPSICGPCAVTRQLSRAATGARR